MPVETSLRPLKDLDRLRKLLEELTRLAQKQQIAKDNGATAAQLEAIGAAIAKVKEGIASAAVAAVAREAKEAQDEARRLREGRPEKPKPEEGGVGDPEP